VGFRKTLPAVIGSLLLVASAAVAHDPIPTGTKRTFSGNVVYYKLVSSPGNWFSGGVGSSLGSYFHDSSNNTSIPVLAYSSTGTATVNYINQSTSPCSGLSNWLQCAINPLANGNWTIYVRDLSGTHGPTGWTWWEEASSCGGNSTCWYLKRAMIHEAGHAMFAFPDMCFGSQPCRSETDTVMNSLDPAVGAPGSTPFSYRRCDEAGGQLAWDVHDNYGEYPACYDHISGHGTKGLLTSITTTVSDSGPCNGVASTVSGTLKVKTTSSYGVLSGNALAGRTVTLQRAIHGGTLADFASTSTSSTGTYSFGVSGSNVSYDFGVVFGATGGSNAGLDASNGAIMTIQWSPPPC
jgi:hypothetical protein